MEKNDIILFVLILIILEYIYIQGNRYQPE